MACMRSWPSTVHQSPTVTLPATQIRMYDSASGEVTPMEIREGEATIYVCGITPYDSTHLGHAATYVTFDLLHRLLRVSGYQVRFVENVTDVDDPLFERAARDGVDWRELGRQQTDLFRSDMEALSIIPPQHYIGVEESMDAIKELVGAMIDSGAAYTATEGPADVYVSAQATGRFGYESRYDADTMYELFARRGGDPDRPGKRDPLDALIWRAEREGEPAWDAPWGRGRPGWHVECAAIASHYLGVPVMVQGGGSDLIFPHHEFSAHHVELACGVERFAGHYMHTGLIGLGGVKMSKSLGNLVFVSRLRAAGTDPSSIRLALYADHYQRTRNWSDALLAQASHRLGWWRQAVDALAARTATAAEGLGAQQVEFAATRDGVLALLVAMRDALANNLDTVTALAAMDHWAEVFVARPEALTALGERTGDQNGTAHTGTGADADQRCATPEVIDDSADPAADAHSLEVARTTSGTKFSSTDHAAEGELTIRDLPAAHESLVGRTDTPEGLLVNGLRELLGITL